jgi:hypothetical protein
VIGRRATDNRTEHRARIGKAENQWFQNILCVLLPLRRIFVQLPNIVSVKYFSTESQLWC